MITGGIQIIQRDYFGGDYLHLITCMSQTGTIQEQKKKIKKALSMFLFITQLESDRLNMPYNYVTNLFTMSKDNWSFVDYSKIDTTEYQIIQPLSNPKKFHDIYELFEKNHKRTKGQYDSTLYKPLLFRANYQNVL